MMNLMLILPFVAIVLMKPADASAPPEAAQEPYRFSNFLSDLNSNRQVRHVHQAIGILPKEMRSHFTLMKESVSLQSATPFAPRAILRTKTAAILNGRMHMALRMIALQVLI